MPYILGIDTGGTYTDGVLVDVHTEEVVARAKALTTKHDLKIGIEECIDELEIINSNDIKMVSLSTTLATNAVVENRVGKTGLILVGNKMREATPTEYIEIVSGESDIKGNIIIPVSEKQVIEAVERLKHKVDAIAVSAYASVRNPSEELKIKKIAEEKTDLPVFCAHELTGTLGYEERTNTAVLNASLIGIIKEFITATKDSLMDKGIEAEMMIVKSDGSLMRDYVALKRPIDTILSGPAASAIGARHLTGVNDALVLDMGGTTIDIAEISDGMIRVGDECAKVAGWQTKVHSVEISTHGVGGDSLITINNEIIVGPHKAEPVSRTAYYYKNIHNEIENILRNTSIDPQNKELLSRCYCLIKESYVYNGNEIHDRIVNLLKEAPHTVAFLEEKICCPLQETLDKMVCNKEINAVEITPTDILHVMGKYDEWDREAAAMRSEILADANDMSPAEFLHKAESAVYKKIYTACVQAVVDFEQKNVDICDDKAAQYLINKLFGDSSNEFLGAECELKKPLVTVGAPVKAWIPLVCEKMNTAIITPKDADVANAIGSAFGEVTELAEALIRKEKGKRKYNLYLPEEKKSFSSKKAALKEAEAAIKEYIKDKASNAGCSEASVVVESKDLYMNPFGEKRKKYIETRIKACAKGRPDVWRI